MTIEGEPSLDEQRRDYKNRRFLAMPLAGMLAWTGIGIAGSIFPPPQAVMALWIGTGSIFYLGVLISRLTGENILSSATRRNEFDRLFFQTTVMALLVFAIVFPFANLDYTSIPLTVGILSGLMWVPLSWAIQHWIGMVHGIARTLAVLGTWYWLPQHRFVAIPAVIVVLYALAIVVLEQRWRGMRSAKMA